MHIFFLGGEREQEEKEDTCKARLAKEVRGWSRREEVMAEEAVRVTRGAKRRCSINACSLPQRRPREHRKGRWQQERSGKKEAREDELGAEGGGGVNCLVYTTPWIYSPWNSPGQNTGMGSLSLLQGIFPSQASNPGLLHCRWILYQLSHREALVSSRCFIIAFSSPRKGSQSRKKKSEMKEQGESRGRGSGGKLPGTQLVLHKCHFLSWQRAERPQVRGEERTRGESRKSKQLLGIPQ